MLTVEFMATEYLTMNSSARLTRSAFRNHNPVHAFSLFIQTIALTILLSVTAMPSFGADAKVGRTESPTTAAKTATSPKKPLVKVTKRLMVPPPPPEIPLVSGDGHVLSTLGVPLDYMSKTDLVVMQNRLQSDETKLSKEADGRANTLKQKKERAEQFEELFKDGVVSKRELENAKKEYAELNEKGPELDLQLNDVRVNLERVKKQIALIDSRQTPAAHTSSKTKTKTTGKEKVSKQPG
jgi:hypothetical protein